MIDSTAYPIVLTWTGRTGRTRDRLEMTLKPNLKSRLYIPSVDIPTNATRRIILHSHLSHSHTSCRTTTRSYHSPGSPIDHPPVDRDLRPGLDRAGSKVSFRRSCHTCGTRVIDPLFSQLHLLSSLLPFRPPSPSPLDLFPVAQFRLAQVHPDQLAHPSGELGHAQRSTDRQAEFAAFDHLPASGASTSPYV